MSIRPTPHNGTLTSPRSAIRRLAVARFVSLAGTEAAFTALLFVLYQRTRSPGLVSVALLLTFGTFGLAGPVAGSLGDRFDRKLVMVCSEVAGGICFAGLAFARSPGHLLLLAFLSALLGSPFGGAASAAVPNLAGREELSWANGTVGMGMNVGFLAGPVLGGVLVATFGPKTVFLANAGSFAVSACLILSIRGRFAGVRDDERDDHRGLRAGIRFLRRDPVLLRMVLAFSIWLIGVGAVVVGELPLSQSFGVGSVGYGLLAASWGTGAAIGAFFARFLTARTEHRGLVFGCMGTALGLASIAVLPVFPAILGAMIVAGGADGLVDVTAETILQRRTPDAVRSRVAAAFEGLLHGMFAVSFVFAGLLVEWLGPKPAYLVAGAGSLVTAAVLSPLLRAQPGRAADDPLPEAVSSG
jgi:MFS family permease